MLLHSRPSPNLLQQAVNVSQTRGRMMCSTAAAWAQESDKTLECIPSINPSLFQYHGNGAASSLWHMLQTCVWGGSLWDAPQGWQQLPLTAGALWWCGTMTLVFINCSRFPFSRLCPKPLWFSGKLSIPSDGSEGNSTEYQLCSACSRHC